MVRKVGLAIAYFTAIVYFLLIVLPAEYCWRTGCKGPGELDAFMPAFFFIPLGATGTGFAFAHAVQTIRKKSSWSWIFWPFAIVFAIVLLGIVAFIAIMIYEMATHR